MSSKIYAICSGGDWADASVDHLILPDGVNIEEEARKCNEYLYKVWFNKEIKDKKYYNLTTWLIEKCGARRPTEDELEEFWED